MLSDSGASAAGITLVVSPLISLMKDQVSTLNQAGIHAAFLNSSLSAAQYRKALGFAWRPVQDYLCRPGTPSDTGIFVRGAVDGNFDD